MINATQHVYENIFVRSRPLAAFKLCDDSLVWCWSRVVVYRLISASPLLGLLSFPMKYGTGTEIFQVDIRGACTLPFSVRVLHGIEFNSCMMCIFLVGLFSIQILFWFILCSISTRVHLLLTLCSVLKMKFRTKKNTKSQRAGKWLVHSGCWDSFGSHDGRTTVGWCLGWLETNWTNSAWFFAWALATSIPAQWIVTSIHQSIAQCWLKAVDQVVPL